MFAVVWYAGDASVLVALVVVGALSCLGFVIGVTFGFCGFVFWVFDVVVLVIRYCSAWLSALGFAVY